ncbi:Mur ligase [Dactylonectria estremocensis]|uniref:Folylpolyglutamate synthase n=1 Tax=Dactylonectria estremocensis TaxID=1079267 RepID=A0A9P9JD06_9HYPO|nr:Mur ligase [Dactylonectria estremocensis]
MLCNGSLTPSWVRARLLTRRPNTRRLVSNIARDYPQALSLLFQLSSNRQITNLFDKPGMSVVAKPSAQDLNAAAISEMREWLRRAGYSPQDLARLRHIHIAGTKGKGSVSAFATGMLREYGTVGTYTSPHLISVRERIAIQGEAISQDTFTGAFFELWDRFTEAAKSEGMDAAEAEGPLSKPFFFRFLTILAWHIFLREMVDCVVLECGIGGEYDATNVLPSKAVSSAVITQLGIDHVAMLGETVEEIAWHKAGILKPNVKGFVRKIDEQPSVRDIIRSRAVEKNAHLVELDDSFVEQWGGVQGNLAGDFQKYNQALAVLAVREHLGMGTDPTTALLDIPEKMARGLKEATLRGRCETIQDGPVAWHLDGAHTKDSLEQVARWFVRTLNPGETATLVFNQQERDATELLAGFLDAIRQAAGTDSVFSHALFTRNDPKGPAVGEVREMAVQHRTARLMGDTAVGCRTRALDNIQDTVAEARRIAKHEGSNHKVLVTGSLHLVGGILQALEPESLL